MNCSNCGAELPQGGKFCPMCGQAVSDRCSACGAELAAGAKFCHMCGAAVGAEAPAAEPKALVFTGDPEFPNVTGFYREGFMISQSSRAVVFNAGQSLARIDKDMKMQTKWWGDYDMPMALAQTRDGIVAATQEGRTESHMPVTLRFYDDSLKETRTIPLLDHCPDMRCSNCTMTRTHFYWAEPTTPTKDENGEPTQDFRKLTVHRFSLADGSESTVKFTNAQLSEACRPFLDRGEKLLIHKVERTLNDGRRLYVDIRWGTWGSGCLRLDPESGTVECLRSAAFFDFDRDLMWLERNGFSQVPTNWKRVAEALIESRQIQDQKETSELQYYFCNEGFTCFPGVTWFVAHSLTGGKLADTVLPVCPSNCYCCTYFDGTNAFYAGLKYGQTGFKTIPLFSLYASDNWLKEDQSPELPPIVWQGRLLLSPQKTGRLYMDSYPLQFEKPDPSEVIHL